MFVLTQAVVVHRTCCLEVSWGVTWVVHWWIVNWPRQVQHPVASSTLIIKSQAQQIVCKQKVELQTTITRQESVAERRSKVEKPSTVAGGSNCEGIRVIRAIEVELSPIQGRVKGQTKNIFLTGFTEAVITRERQGRTKRRLARCFKHLAYDHFERSHVENGRILTEISLFHWRWARIFSVIQDWETRLFRKKLITFDPEGVWTWKLVHYQDQEQLEKTAPRQEKRELQQETFLRLKTTFRIWRFLWSNKWSYQDKTSVLGNQLQGTVQLSPLLTSITK